MKIAVQGCAHGELDKIYEAIQNVEERDGIKVDLLICCGDFQAVRNVDDLRCMAVPSKYQNICSFYK
jgi:lariat debranching enzyme